MLRIAKNDLKAAHDLAQSKSFSNLSTADIYETYAKASAYAAELGGSDVFDVFVANMESYLESSGWNVSGTVYRFCDSGDLYGVNTGNPSGLCFAMIHAGEHNYICSSVIS